MCSCLLLLMINSLSDTRMLVRQQMKHQDHECRRRVAEEVAQGGSSCEICEHGQLKYKAGKSSEFSWMEMKRALSNIRPLIPWPTDAFRR